MTDTVIARSSPVLVVMDISKVHDEVLIAILDKKMALDLPQRATQHGSGGHYTTLP